MTSVSLTINYNVSQDADPPWIRLTQEPVSSNKLTDEDLATMLALVMSGTSARAYKPENCEATVLSDEIIADLAVKVWPSSLDIAYGIVGDLVTIGEKTALQEWHEFDLIVPMSNTVDIPYLCTEATVTWQTPAYNSRGVEVDKPSITKSANKLVLGAEVFGVLRVKCLALGWRHALQFSWAKTDASAITNLKPAVVVSWAEGEERLELELPGCIEALLAFCPDGNSKRARSMSTVDSEEDEVVPVVYWSPCSGRMLAIRYERP